MHCALWPPTLSQEMTKLTSSLNQHAILIWESRRSCFVLTGSAPYDSIFWLICVYIQTTSSETGL